VEVRTNEYEEHPMPPLHEVAAPTRAPQRRPSFERLRDRATQLGFRALVWLAPLLARLRPLRRWLGARYLARAAENLGREAAAGRFPQSVVEDRVAITRAFVEMAERGLGGGRLNRTSLRGLLQNLLGDVLARKGDQGPKQRFRARFGCSPPDLLVISPGKACNLRCTGCYANAGPAREKLDYATVDRVIREAHDLWGMRFIVLSGGEPLAWKDAGKGVLDLAEAHPDCFFMAYTNGTLISDVVAERVARLGNFSPAISVEGLRARTDARRGAGVFDKVLDAMRRLRQHGVLFGMSLTATRENAEEILSDAMLELFFEQMGVLYAWIFHYMPIGRSFTHDLLVTPEQRLALWQRTWQVVRERRHFLADFWNGATLTSGCIAAGRPGGYLYLDWNGAVCPCVFVPYSPVNIKDAYASGKTLEDVWQEPFFAGIRAWQRDYGYREKGEAQTRRGNWLLPCPIRDHHDEFRAILDRHEAQPADEDARAALADPAYRAGLEAYDRALAATMEPVWQRVYLEPARERQRS
jgi:MoaA/NifB/PqqE/SkfB family radical SAM enzyme